MYKDGDRGTTGSENSAVTSDLQTEFHTFKAKQMAMNEEVKEYQCTLGDVMTMLVSGGASMLGGPSSATITTSSASSGIDFAGIMAKNTAAIIEALNLNNNNGSNNGGLRNRNTSATTTTTQKEVINYWRQWVLYCFKCGVNLGHHSSGCPKKGTNHIDDSTFTNKKEGHPD